MTLQTFMLTLEALGVVAFALSGIIEAARKHFDLVGVAMAGLFVDLGFGILSCASTHKI